MRSRRLAVGSALRVLAICLLACCPACVRTPPGVAPSQPATLLTVVTWNMHGGKGDLPRLIADLDAGRLTGAPATDYLLLLQEFVDPVDDRAMANWSTRVLTRFARQVRRGAGNAIVSTLPLADTRTIELPRERQPRGAVVATVLVGGETLFVVSAHLENRLALLRGLFGDRARGRQAQALLQALPATGPGIVGGDLNTMLGPDEPAWRTLLQRFADTPGEPQPTFRDRLVLDHLFFDLPDRWTVARRVVDDQYASDHHPVVGEIRSQ